ncbi:MAG: hypothetical protein LUH82_05125 [Clostridiales bacterium]|nr:hypothetical protein [Clostridiales bacterium]
MNKAYKIKNGLIKAGRQVQLTDGDWASVPFYAVVEDKWRDNQTNFEYVKTALGNVSADYYTYIGPFDHDIEALSNTAQLIMDGDKFIFKKREKIVCAGQVQFYTGVLRKIWGSGDVLPE